MGRGPAGRGRDAPGKADRCTFQAAAPAAPVVRFARASIALRAPTTDLERPVSSYKVEQSFVRHAGRTFHFVSYDHEPANERRGLPAVPAMWYLMGPAKRWPAIPQVAGQPPEELEAALIDWLRAQGLDRRSAQR